jgi:4-coumarate--CoA ligase
VRIAGLLEEMIAHLLGTVGAAVIGEPDEVAGEAELQAHVEGCLAHYKHPGEYRFVESVPKSASGKILRRELRAGL